MSKKTLHNENTYNNPPETLDNHPFYGLVLDEEQKAFRDAIWDPEKIIIFVDAKAGTGKTFIATATALLLKEYKFYKGIIFVASPTQENKVGFLPGDVEQKSLPYFEPFYQALRKLNYNPDYVVNSIANQKEGTGFIETYTHTYFRGCNFEDKVIIIDEAQNYDFDSLKKTLTRMHDNCKVIVIGHSLQKDINEKRDSFKDYLEHFKNANDSRVAVCNLTKNYRGWISTFADSLE